MSLILFNNAWSHMYDNTLSALTLTEIDTTDWLANFNEEFEMMSVFFLHIHDHCLLEYMDAK